VSPPRFEELEVGTELAPLTGLPLTVTDFVRYQGASGDMNPIHHDTEFARRSGFPTPFAVGMLQAGVLATYLTDIFGATAVVVGTRTEHEQHLVDLEATVTRQTGGVHLQGWATFVAQ
jgi:acyl dehydratase